MKGFKASLQTGSAGPESGRKKMPSRGLGRERSWLEGKGGSRFIFFSYSITLEPCPRLF